MSSTISTIAKSAQNATPSMKNLTDSVKGLDIMQGAVQKAVEINDISTIANAKNACEELKSTVQRMGEGVSDDILKMKPTISNVRMAGQEVEKLIALQKELGENGHLLNDAVTKAQANMAELGKRTFQTQTEMKMLKSAITGINSMPFVVMSVLVADLIKGMKDFGAEFNERFDGVPAKIAQVTAAVLALTVALGLAFTKTTALGLSTSYFMTLWKSSIIYQGLAGFITMATVLSAKIWACATATSAWLVAQLGLNTAWTYFLASTGIGLILVAVAGIAAGVASLLSGFSQTSNEIQKCTDRTNAFRDAIKDVIAVSRSMVDEQKRYLEAQMTGLEKYEARLKNIDQLLTLPKRLEQERLRISSEIRTVEESLQKLDRQKNKDLAAQLNQQLDGLWEDRKTLEKTITEARKFNGQAAIAAKNQERLEYLKGRYSNLIEKTMTAQEQYTDTLERIKEDLKLGEQGFQNKEVSVILANAKQRLRDQLGIAESPAALLAKQMDALQFALDKKIISDVEYAEAVQRAKEQWDPAMKTSIEAAKNLAREQERLAAEFKNMVDRFKGMGKTPLESFKELSVDLRRVQDALTPAEFASAKNKLLSDLASGLGIAQFLTDAATPAKQLAETYRNLDAYAREANLSMQELTAAKNRAREALEKQSEYYNLYQKAQDAMLTAQQKLNRELSRIAEEAAKWGWDKSIVAKMEELKIEELQQQALLDESKKHTGLLDNIDKGVNIKNRNPALEFGTVAYYEAQKKDTNKPLEKEVRQANKYLADINRSVKPSNTGNRQPFVLIG